MQRSRMDHCLTICPPPCVPNWQVEKYRPQKLEELVAHEDIISILTRLIDNDNLPHLLLYGPPGTGKVSPQSLARGTRHEDKIA